MNVEDMNEQPRTEQPQLEQEALRSITLIPMPQLYKSAYVLYDRQAQTSVCSQSSRLKSKYHSSRLSKLEAE